MSERVCLTKNTTEMKLTLFVASSQVHSAIQTAMRLLVKNLHKQFNLTLISLAGTGFYSRHQKAPNAAKEHGLIPHKDSLAQLKFKKVPNTTWDTASATQLEYSKSDRVSLHNAHHFVAADFSGHARSSYMNVPLSGLPSKRKERELREQEDLPQKAIKACFDSKEDRGAGDWAAAILKMASNVSADKVCGMLEGAQLCSAGFTDSGKVEENRVKRAALTPTLTPVGKQGFQDLTRVQLYSPKGTRIKSHEELGVSRYSSTGQVSVSPETTRGNQRHSTADLCKSNVFELCNRTPARGQGNKSQSHQSAPPKKVENRFSKTVRGPMDAFVLRKL